MNRNGLCFFHALFPLHHAPPPVFLVTSKLIQPLEMKMSSGTIRADELYTLEEVKTRLKLGNHALRQARIRGLQTKKVGRNKYVLGKHLIEFISNQDSE